MMRKGNRTAACLIAVCALLCCGCGEKGSTTLIGEVQEARGTEDLEAESPAQESPVRTPEGAEPESEAAESVIRVYVCGAVMNPGVVEIPQGSRVEDALKAAGGFGADAGREAVNLADWVADGQKLYFPRADEAVPESADGAAASSGLVNINTADAAALCTLPGIGESRAKDIIAYREENGGFGSCEDIMKVPGIKTAVYEKIRDSITVR